MLKIFVAGATGAIGKPTIKRLLQEGHILFGMTRSAARARELESMGVTPVLGNALHTQEVEAAMKLTRPDVVIEMLTSLPKNYTPQAMQEASVQDVKLRIEGGANLQRAAVQIGVKRYLVQSSAFWYAPGISLADETTPFAFDASPGIAAGTRVYAAVEERVLQAKELTGVALRFGFFYGPGTWFCPEGDVADQIRHQRYPVIGEGKGLWHFVHVEDCANAIVAALTCPAGAYNIVNDMPVAQSVWVPAFASWLGAPPPPRRSVEEELRINGPDTVYYATSLRGASNAKAKRDLSFKPRSLEWLDVLSSHGLAI